MIYSYDGLEDQEMTQLQKKHDNGGNEVLAPKRNKHEVREAVKAKISSSSAKGIVQTRQVCELHCLLR